MNLINDAWIPVRKKNGEKIIVAPWQITEGIGTDNEIIELAAVRPDFNGALIQFLIGLLQTTCAPQGNSDWRKWLNSPPSAVELKKKFEPIAFAFNLDGDGPRFMQDLTIEKDDKKTEETVEKLLMDAPGDQTLKQNKDLFIKRERIDNLCQDCCAQALLTLQLNAPGGGKGHRVGLRGGGPVNTLVLGDSLWQTAWNNVLAESEYNELATISKHEQADRFPWCASPRTSESDRATTPQDVHPAQVYWSTPRRIRLKSSEKQGKCDLCSAQGCLVSSYYTKPYGVKYDGFIFPLTPTYKNKDGMILPVHQHEALGYKHWLGYVQSTDNGNEPARVMKTAFGRRLSNFRLWAFGYDMDNMKACCWYEGVMPIIFIDDEKQWGKYNSEIAMLIRAADSVSDHVAKAVTRALNSGVFNIVRQRFWQESESEFYRQITCLRDEIARDKDGVSVRKAWHDNLVKKALVIFNDMSQAEMIEQVNAKRVAEAYNGLRKNLYGNKLKTDILRLPKQ